MTEALAGRGPGGEGGQAFAPPPTPAVLWLAAFQALADRGAHDLRNALNAVAVNLEVVRSRSGRGAPGEQVVSFAATAARELESVSARAEALLSLSRPGRGGADVAAVLRDLARLLGGDAAAAGGGALRVQVAPDMGGTGTSAPVDLVRAVLARAVLNTVREDDGGATAEVARAEGAPDAILVRVRSDHAPVPPIDPIVAVAASEHGVLVAPTAHGFELRFPTIRP